jgi:hypothetical protein
VTWIYAALLFLLASPPVAVTAGLLGAFAIRRSSASLQVVAGFVALSSWAIAAGAEMLVISRLPELAVSLSSCLVFAVPFLIWIYALTRLAPRRHALLVGSQA